MNKPIIVVAVILLVAGFLMAVYNESVLVSTVSDYGMIADVVVHVYPYQLWGVILLIVGGVTGLIGYFVPGDLNRQRNLQTF